VNADPWAVLGVEPTATLEEIRTAYRTRSMLLHPDLHGGRPDAVRREAERAMSQLTAAYDAVTAARKTPKKQRRRRGWAYRLGWILGRSRRRARG
jgi:curved DNA-binding protein CbpA